MIPQTKTSAVRLAIATRGLRSIADAAYRVIAGRHRTPKPRSMSAIKSNQGASCARKKKVVSQTKLGRPALGIKIVLKLKARQHQQLSPMRIRSRPAAIRAAPYVYRDQTAIVPERTRAVFVNCYATASARSVCLIDVGSNPSKFVQHVSILFRGGGPGVTEVSELETFHAFCRRIWLCKQSSQLLRKQLRRSLRIAWFDRHASHERAR